MNANHPVPAEDLARAPREVLIGRLAGLPALPDGDFSSTTAQLAAMAKVPLLGDVTLPGSSASFFRASEAALWLRARDITPDWQKVPGVENFADTLATTKERG